ncbi:MAG: class I tRNA ligase family protein, partial [bacterium]
CSRFLNRIWRLVQMHKEILSANFDALKSGAPSELTEKDDLELERQIHLATKRVTQEVEERFHFNTAIAATMELANALYAYVGGEKASPANAKLFAFGVERLLLLLSPFAPHLCEEIWHQLGRAESVLKMPWPAYDASKLLLDEIEIVVQINGKVRSRLTIPADLDDDSIRARALADPKVLSLLAGKTPRKVIVVPKKLVNVVV